ncbi:MAG TPA: DUF3300 domain-containing protein [Woeseiaceae bacterium]|nr:DUF3300 domain-containing protein [Woeseiaceae bacterium]
MNRQSWTIAAFCALAAIASVPAYSQVPVDDQGNPLGSAADAGGYGEAAQPVALTATELAELVGPVALYPDDLLAIVLPASTYPLEIVQAARFLEQYEQDSTLQPNEEWDESVTALLNYPEVLRMMNEDIDWTWQLGDAVVNQQADVIAAVESFRDRAYAAGNLKSDQYQTVTEDDGIIEIVPVDEEIIYVPYYEPQQVVVRQVTPVYYYYPQPYPVYYYPYPAGYSFYTGYFWGVTTAFRIGWLTDHLHVHHHSYWGHPYFGHSYYGHYYRRPSVHVYNSWYVSNSTYYSSNRYRDGDYWRPRTHSRARPAYYSSRTRSYRGNDVDRGSSARAYGNASSMQIASQGMADRSGRQTASGDRQRSDPASVRDVRSDTIRFRERSENRQSLRREPAATATRSGSSARTEQRSGGDARSEREIRRAPVSTAATTAVNRTRESVRESVRESRNGSNAPRQTGNVSQATPRTNPRNVTGEAARVEVRNPAPQGRAATANSRQDSRHDSRHESRHESRQDSREGSRQASRQESRGESRAEPRTESRPESRSDSRSESRAESRQTQASVREGNQVRRGRN